MLHRNINQCLFNSGQPLHGKGWEQSLDYFHGNCSKPLAQVCGRHLGQNHSKGSGSLHITCKCCGQSHQVHTGRCQRRRLSVLDRAVHTEEGSSLNIEVNRKPTHTDQYLLFDFRYPLEHKPSGWGRAHGEKGKEGKTEAHQPWNPWLPKLDLCQNLWKIQGTQRGDEETSHTRHSPKKLLSKNHIKTKCRTFFKETYYSFGFLSFPLVFYRLL